MGFYLLNLDFEQIQQLWPKEQLHPVVMTPGIWIILRFLSFWENTQILRWSQFEVLVATFVLVDKNPRNDRQN